MEGADFSRHGLRIAVGTGSPRADCSVGAGACRFNKHYTQREINGS